MSFSCLFGSECKLIVRILFLGIQISKLHIISDYESSDKLSEPLYVYTSGMRY
jgi:hypothetical protein